MSKQAQKPRFIKPPNRLKAKVGLGGIDEQLLDKAQTYIKTVEINFKPTAKQLLDDAIDNFKVLSNAKTQNEKNVANDNLANSIMQIKANGGMFGYQLMGEIAANALHFIENCGNINTDALNLIDVHTKAMQLILANNLKGDGGQEGFALVKELEKACHRYYKKYPET